MLCDWTLSRPVLRACNDIPRLQDLSSLFIARLRCHGTESRHGGLSIDNTAQAWAFDYTDVEFNCEIVHKSLFMAY